MATGTGAIEVQDVLNKIWNPAGTAPTASPDSISIYVAGGSALAGSGSGPVSGQPAIVGYKSFRQSILDSATTATSSATGTWMTGLGAFSIVEVFIRFSSFTGTVSTVDIYIDSRLDGTNSVNIAHLTQLTSASGATAANVIRLTKLANAGAEIGNVAADIGAGTVRNIGWGDDLRIRRDISGGTTAPIFTYVVTVNGVS